MSVEILHGDCRETLKTLPNSCADMVLLDPPHDQWLSAQRVFTEIPRLCTEGFIICFCRVSDISDLLEIGRWERLELFDSLVWHDPQPSFVHFSRVLRTHEHILVFKSGKPELPTLKLGAPNADKEPKNKGQSSLGKWRGGQRVYAPADRKHLTSVLTFARPLSGPLGRWQKPSELIRLLISAYCRNGGTVLDPFAGSGTTGQVAMEEGRNAILCELNEDYVGLIRKRIDGVTPSLFGRAA